MCCRLVPLSEGRLESDGTLQCSYHGWRFDTEGHCTTVPQAENNAEQSRIKQMQKSCVVKFPLQVKLLVQDGMQLKKLVATRLVMLADSNNI